LNKFVKYFRESPHSAPLEKPLQVARLAPCSIYDHSPLSRWPSRTRTDSTPRAPAGEQQTYHFTNEEDGKTLLILWRATVDEDGHYSFAVAL
jgi:hypothetical protein